MMKKLFENFNKWIGEETSFFEKQQKLPREPRYGSNPEEHNLLDPFVALFNWVRTKLTGKEFYVQGYDAQTQLFRLTREDVDGVWEVSPKELANNFEYSRIQTHLDEPEEDPNQRKDANFSSVHQSSSSDDETQMSRTLAKKSKS